MVLSLESKLQKNRFKKKTVKKNLKFGDYGLLIIKGGRIELIQLFFLKKLLKKVFLRKKKFNMSKYRKLWFFIVPNHILQKKSKNSRMGKGKGMFERNVIRVQNNKFLMEFTGINILKIKNLLKKIEKKISIKLMIYTKKQYFYSLWTKKNKYNFYYNKYLV